MPPIGSHLDYEINILTENSRSDAMLGIGSERSGKKSRDVVLLKHRVYKKLVLLKHRIGPVGRKSGTGIVRSY